MQIEGGGFLPERVTYQPRPQDQVGDIPLKTYAWEAITLRVQPKNRHATQANT